MDTSNSKSFGKAITFFQEGQLESAIAECRAILVLQPRHVDALHMIGLSLARLQRKEEAVVPMEQAIQLQPGLPALCNNLGEVYRQLGRLTDAERLFRRALSLQDKFSEAAMNLGNTLKDQDRYSEAIEWFQHAVDWKPNYANAHLNLANTLFREGRTKRAVQHYREFLQYEPGRCDVLLSLGGAYAELGDHASAKQFYHQAEVLDPENVEVCAAMGHVALAEGDRPLAEQYYQKNSARHPDCLLKSLLANQLCELILPSNAEIDEYRAGLAKMLERLQNEPKKIDLEQLHSSGAEPPMMLAYQGRNDRLLKEQYASLFADQIAPIELGRRTGKPHLGVVVTNGHEGVYAECLGRLVARLASSSDLDVTVVCSRSGANIIPHLLGASPVRYLVLAERVTESASRLAEAKFDLLHYWEVGTDSMNYFLPLFRPAPVQSACWGWPVTTGQPHIQYFVSSRWIEPNPSAHHYSERVVPLETLPTWYSRPPVPLKLRRRAEYGWSDNQRVYLCTQNLRKYHPDFDPILAEILRRDSQGCIYAIDDSQPAVGLRLRARFAQRFPDVANRLQIVPRKERTDYLNLVALADVVLDTPHYGGGANSIYDAFACGTPIITRPGEFHRGRYAQGVCRKLELPEMIADTADEYVSRAVQIATQPDFRESLQRKIRERSSILFEDDSAVDQHQQFFLEAIAKERSR